LNLEYKKRQQKIKQKAKPIASDEPDQEEPIIETTPPEVYRQLEIDINEEGERKKNMNHKRKEEQATSIP